MGCVHGRVRRVTAKNKNCEFCTPNSAQLLENLTPFTQLCHACFCKVNALLRYMHGIPLWRTADFKLVIQFNSRESPDFCLDYFWLAHPPIRTAPGAVRGRHGRRRNRWRRKRDARASTHPRGPGRSRVRTMTPLRAAPRRAQ